MVLVAAGPLGFLAMGAFLRIGYEPSLEIRPESDMEGNGSDTVGELPPAWYVQPSLWQSYRMPPSRIPYNHGVAYWELN